MDPALVAMNSSRSGSSHASIESGFSGSASGGDRRPGRRATPPRRTRQGLLSLSNFALTSEKLPASFDKEVPDRITGVRRAAMQLVCR